ncbi:MAG: hypothetical protein AAF337_07925 [Pseudomonadota bacterium]
MKNQRPSYLAPRESDLVMAHSFTPQVGAGALAQRLAGIGLYEPIALSIHLPFDDSEAQTSRYLDGLLDEMRLAAKAMAGCGRVVHIQFKGSRATALKVDHLSRVLDEIERQFGLTDETSLALEINPRVVSYQDAEDLSRLGITQVSLAVYDFSPAVQRALGQVQPARMVTEVVAAFRVVGIFEIGFEMAYGLPNQSVRSIEKSILQAVDIKPDQVVLAGPEPKGAQAGTCDALMKAAQQMLTNQGYSMIGFNHFALPGSSLAQAACQGRLKHSLQGFSDTPAKVTIGFGAAAISQFPNAIIQNEPDVAKYYEALASAKLPAARGVHLSREDQLRAAVIDDLLCHLETDLAKHCSHFNVKLSALDAALKALDPFASKGVVTIRESVIRIPEPGRAMAQRVANVFDVQKPTHTQLSSAL